MIHVYGIKSCDSVKKALKFFKEHSIDVCFTDYRADPIEDEKIATWASKSDINLLFNARSRTYKDLGLSKLTLDKDAKIQWMQKEPLLIKRPVIEYNDQIYVGFTISTYEETFLS